MSGKEIDKTIALKGVKQGEDESRELGREIKSKKSKSEKKKHEINYEPSKKAYNDVSLEDLKCASFLHRLTKVSKTNLNAKIYDIFKTSLD